MEILQLIHEICYVRIVFATTVFINDFTERKHQNICIYQLPGRIVVAELKLTLDFWNTAENTRTNKICHNRAQDYIFSYCTRETLALCSCYSLWQVLTRNIHQKNINILHRSNLDNFSFAKKSRKRLQHVKIMTESALFFTKKIETIENIITIKMPELDRSSHR